MSNHNSKVCLICCHSTSRFVHLGEALYCNTATASDELGDCTFLECLRYCSKLNFHLSGEYDSLCCDCADKLKKTYQFLQQLQRAYERLLLIKEEPKYEEAEQQLILPYEEGDIQMDSAGETEKDPLQTNVSTNSDAESLSNEISVKRRQLETISTPADNTQYAFYNANKKNKRTSGMWLFFIPIDNNRAKCKTCKQMFSYKTSTSNLWRHLKSMHPKILTQSTKPDQVVKRPLQATRIEELTRNDVSSHNGSIRMKDAMQNAISSSMSAQDKPFVDDITMSLQKKRSSECKQIAISEQKKEQADQHLIEMFTQTFHTFNLVNEEPFRNLLNTLNSGYEIPSRHWISQTAIPMAYEQCTLKVRKMVEAAKAICITTDCWTCRNVSSFCAVTANFIDDKFRMISVLLDCSSMDINPTVENLAIALEKITVDFNITEKVTIAVSDNTANIKKAIERLQWDHLGCLAHTLNQIVKDALKCNGVVTKVLLKVKNIVTYFRKSHKNHQIILNYQIKQGKKTPLKLKNDCPTRWNSTLFMLQRFCELEDAVKQTCEDPFLSATEWQVVRQLCTILQPWESATNILSEEINQTAAIVITIVDCLQTLMKRIETMDLQLNVLSIVKHLRNALDKRLGNVQNCKTLWCSTFCDPRFKCIPFMDEGQVSMIKEFFIDAVAAEISEEMRDNKAERPVNTFPSVSVPNELSLWHAFDKKAAASISTCTAHSKAAMEVQRYIEFGVIARSECPLNWWKSNQYMYPHLAKVAQKMLCALATSVPGEQLFSKTGELMSERRSRLKAENTQMLVFLNANSNYLS